MSKHKARIRLVHPDDFVKYISESQARDWLRRREAVIISLEPLTLRVAQFPEYRDEARRRRGKVIPGIEHPDPDRILAPIGAVPRVFDHHPVKGSDQGVCFPPGLIPEEIAYRAYRREYLRTHSENEYAETIRRQAERRRITRRSLNASQMNIVNAAKQTRILRKMARGA